MCVGNVSLLAVVPILLVTGIDPFGYAILNYF